MPPFVVSPAARVIRNGWLYHQLLTPCRLVAQCSSRTSYALPLTRQSSSSSSTRWKSRQGRDSFAREAKVRGLQSRAAFKLLEIDSKYKLFKKGQTVIDLGYAPGSWSQVAVERTKPNGRIIGIDIIPAQPPKGVSTIQGNFLTKEVQAEIKKFLIDPHRGRPRNQMLASTAQEPDLQTPGAVTAEDPQEDGPARDKGKKLKDGSEKTIDIVLSDMSAPWEQTNGFWKRSLSNPYIRMMNTSGIPFRDHTGSMDLCNAALEFSYDTLKTGGHFVCKFYQGAEDKQLENRLKKLFGAVHREKPESSRSVR
ncbi:2' O-ribose methyltransferase [Pseudogymnoascus australis]